MHLFYEELKRIFIQRKKCFYLPNTWLTMKNLVWEIITSDQKLYEVRQWAWVQLFECKYFLEWNCRIREDGYDVSSRAGKTSFYSIKLHFILLISCLLEDEQILSLGELVAREFVIFCWRFLLGFHWISIYSSDIPNANPSKEKKYVSPMFGR